MKYLFGLMVLVFLSGCMLFNPVKRMSLEEIDFKKSLPRTDKHVVVWLEEVVPGKPLNETVWDSASGPFWDQEESRQIGLTVSYQIDPLIMPTGATAVTTAKGALWVVPFGPLMSGMMKSALDQHFLGSVICYDAACADAAIASTHADSLLRVRPTFRVWTPSPTSLNLNYASEVTFGVYSSSSLGLVRSGKSNLTRENMKLNPIISYKAISEMRDYSKEYMEAIVADLLTKAYSPN
jgi:hypothetical protein